MSSDKFLAAAIEEARLGLAEGGIPIGSVLVCDGAIIGRGHNHRVQNGSAILHGEMDCPSAGQGVSAMHDLYDSLALRDVQRCDSTLQNSFLGVRDDERFGKQDLARLCRFLCEDLQLLHRSGDLWHWVSDSYPADSVSLRAVTSDNFLVVDITGDHRIIGEVDFPSALTTLHEKAIYLHDAVSSGEAGFQRTQSVCTRSGFGLLYRCHCVYASE